MDTARRKELRRQGKAQIERDSAERKAKEGDLGPDMRAALDHTGDFPADPSKLPADARARYEKELWLVKTRPTIDREQLYDEFVALPDVQGKWQKHPLGYVMCKRCQSALPAIPPRRWHYTAHCVCGNLQWRCWFGFGKLSVREPEKALPVRVFGRAKLKD